LAAAQVRALRGTQNLTELIRYSVSLYFRLEEETGQATGWINKGSLTKAVPGIEGNLPTLSDHDAHLYIRDDSGGLLVGCFEPLGKPIDPDVLGEDFSFQLLPEDWDHFEPMMMNALHRLPLLT
jgi:hypothetical protein